MKATALFLAASALAAVSAAAGAEGVDDVQGQHFRCFDGLSVAQLLEGTSGGQGQVLVKQLDARYAYTDVVASSLLNRSGVFNIGGELNLNLARDWKQEIGAEYMAFCDGLLSDKDAFDASWKAVKELFPNLSFRGGYELNYGGLPGYLSKHMGKAPHSLAQSVTAGLAYDDPGHGYFGSLDVQYGFYGMTGWRIDLNAGKRWSGLIHEKVDLELSAGTGYSSSYWGPGVAGFDQVNIKLAAPVRVTGVDSSRGFRIIPFIQLDWAGNTRSEIRRYAGMNAIEDFRIRVGVEAVYRF